MDTERTHKFRLVTTSFSRSFRRAALFKSTIPFVHGADQVMASSPRHVLEFKPAPGRIFFSSAGDTHRGNSFWDPFHKDPTIWGTMPSCIWAHLSIEASKILVAGTSDGRSVA